MLLSVPVDAQERFGELNGTATDPSGAVLPDVAVTATNTTTQRVVTTRTGADGTYVLRQLEPGFYSVKFEVTGFTPYQVAQVELLAGRILKVNAPLTVSGTEQTVQVTEAAPLIDVTRTTIAHDITASEIALLPKARSFQQLAVLAPSVNSGDIEGGFQVNGASGAENQFIIDGVSTNSLINGRSRQDAFTEILQEVQVKTGGIDAEYGGALGGVISAITKSGGNQFHGDVHYYHDGSTLSAGPVKRLLLDPGDERTVSYVQDYKNPNRRHEVGFSLGGPIVKEKLFFFSAFSPRFVRRENTYIFSDGTDTLKQKRTEHQMFNKVNWDPTQKLRTTFTWLWTPTKSLGRLPAFDYYGNQSTNTLESAAPNKVQGFFQPQSSYTGQIDFTPTPTSLLTIRAGRFWDDYKSTGVPDVSSIQYTNSAENLPFDIPEALRQPALFTTTPRVQNTYYDLTARTYVQVDASKFLTFFGQHNIKGGWGLSKTVNKVRELYPGNGYISINWDQSYNSPNIGAGRGTYGYYTVNDIGVEGSTGGTMNNLYIQDQWRILPRLTLTLGLRTENEVVPSFRRDLKDFAFKFGFQDKIAPRLGASFDVFGDGRVKVYGSWGRYFDWVKYELSRGTFGGDYWRRLYRPLDTLDLASLSPSGFAGRNLWNDEPGGFRNLRTTSFGPEAVDPNIKPMSSDLTNAGTEIQLGERSVLRVNYVHNALRRTMEDVGVLIDGDEHYAQVNPGEGLGAIMLGTCNEDHPEPNCTPNFAMPKPKRVYDAMEVTFNRRFAGNTFFSFSYVLSRLYGNYAGLANSDEINTPTTGVTSSTAQQQGGSIARPGSNATRGWDLAEYMFDSRGNVNVEGRLATDRPHVFKLYGSKQFNWNNLNASDVGLFFYGGSGTPLTTNVITSNSIGVFVNGRGDMGRTPWLTQTDLLVGHEFKLGENQRLRFEFNALNLFNQKTARSRFVALNRGAGVDEEQSAINLNSTNLFNGYDYRALLNNTQDQLSGRGAYDPRYGLSDLFNNGFTGRFGVKYTF
ncbi:MAG TPA: TonB-dependent receptor [Bryobacteraceae bacterium]|nr:TonB-dependent receptor [Bryobacteraceae bacterium]